MRPIFPILFISFIPVDNFLPLLCDLAPLREIKLPDSLRLRSGHLAKFMMKCHLVPPCSASRFSSHDSQSCLLSIPMGLPTAKGGSMAKQSYP